VIGINLVKVNLGNYPITGIVVKVDVKSEFDKLKPILEVLDEKPLLDSSMLALLDWASRYYFYPIGEVLFHALPKTLRKGNKPPQLTLWTVNKNKEFDNQDNEKGHPPPFFVFTEQLKRSPKQSNLFTYLWENGESDAIQLQHACGDNWMQTI